MFKRFWKKINGKKTIGGVIVTAAGVAMFSFPFTAPAAPYILSTGLGILGIGGSHKVIKYLEEKKQSKEDTNESK